MPIRTVRVSEEEKLLRRGELSKSVREVAKFYLNFNSCRELLARLDELQKGTLFGLPLPKKFA